MFDDEFDEQWFIDRVVGRERVFEQIGGLCLKKRCKSILDVGGGMGLLNNFIFPLEHTVVDLSPKAKLHGEPRYPHVKFITGTLWDVPNTYDAVIASSVVEHMKSLDYFLKLAWPKTNKFVLMTFHNGFCEKERRRYYGSKDKYYENTYRMGTTLEFVQSQLKPSRFEVRYIPIDRKYSPEPVLIIYREEV